MVWFIFLRIGGGSSSVLTDEGSLLFSCFCFGLCFQPWRSIIVFVLPDTTVCDHTLKTKRKCPKAVSCGR